MRRVAAAAAIAVCALAVPAFATAHILHSNGTWTYRYLTRSSAGDCGSGSTGSDPLNVIFFQYGEGNRMNSHAEADTHWGFYSGPRIKDWICGDTDGSPGNYTLNDFQNFDDQEGHGGIWCVCAVRAHFRIWYAPHGHGDLVDKWSTIDAHHEHDAFSTDTVFTHHIDEDWETWEYHIGSELGGSGHNFFYDYWARQGGQYLQGFYDDGFITRVGGLHNGTY
jgi:hypothetical protein